MKDGCFAISISVVLHLTLISLFLGMSAKPLHHSRPILLDFTISKTDFSGRHETGRVSRPPSPVAGKRGRSPAPAAVPAAGMPVSEEPRIATEERVSDIRVSSPATTLTENISAGQAAPSGQADNVPASTRIGQGNLAAGKAGTVRGSSDGRQAASGKVLRIGDGGDGDKTYPFIKEEISRNMRYPDKAHRMGWQGTVVVDFVVHENGSIHDIRIVRSSGYQVLDDCARDTLSRITFARKLPEKLAFRYDVQYRLQ